MTRPSLPARARAHLSYGNVVATIALFAALGTGGAYAAAQLDRNSVGPKQIRAGAVRGSDVKNGSLGVRELSSKARRSLRGATGPTGPAGAPATTYRAAVSEICGSPVGNAIGADPIDGGCKITFRDDVSGCVYNATLAAVFNGSTAPDPGPGRITVASAGGASVDVRTYNPDATPRPKGFHLLVAC